MEMCSSCSSEAILQRIGPEIVRRDPGKRIRDTSFLVKLQVGLQTVILLEHELICTCFMRFLITRV